MKRSMENEGKKEYIEREALIKGFTSDGCRFVYGNSTVKAIVSRIMVTPAADVAPVVHGEWVEQVKIARKSNINPLYYYQCSLCGVYLAKRANFCPNCGAKMDGERREV